MRTSKFTNQRPSQRMAGLRAPTAQAKKNHKKLTKSLSDGKRWHSSSSDSAEGSRASTNRPHSAKTSSSSAALSTAVSMLQLMKEVGEQAKAAQMAGKKRFVDSTTSPSPLLDPKQLVPTRQPAPRQSLAAPSTSSSIQKRRRVENKLKLPPPFCTCNKKSPAKRINGSGVLSVELLRRRNEEELMKQNCHFCGRCKHKQDRIICKNPYCSLQGQRTKYICRACVEYQQEYFQSIGVNWKNILGDINDPEWYCPSCVIWEDGFLPYPGLCCCSFRRNQILCPLHKECNPSPPSPRASPPSSVRMRRFLKTNYHCKPYKQKISNRMRRLEFDIRRVRLGSKPHQRIYLTGLVGNQSSKVDIKDPTPSKAPTYCETCKGLKSESSFRPSSVGNSLPRPSLTSKSNLRAKTHNGRPTRDSRHSSIPSSSMQNFSPNGTVPPAVSQTTLPYSQNNPASGDSNGRTISYAPSGSSSAYSPRRTTSDYTSSAKSISGYSKNGSSSSGFNPSRTSSFPSNLTPCGFSNGTSPEYLSNRTKFVSNGAAPSEGLVPQPAKVVVHL
mmetsp:Transcript_4381/g.10269  ORF Transcript_4381/g.10269 Transcript_4381/m.10269 type:complete len:556 (-) Transcript_4381:223-1890(-)